MEVLSLVSEFFSLSNTAVNFFIYAAFNKHFRGDVRSMFKCNKKEDIYQSNQDPGTDKTTIRSQASNSTTTHEAND